MGRLNCASNFINAILGKDRPMNTPEEALILMKILDGIYGSAQSGKPVCFG
jgi:predicted dehydrogenase